MNNELITPPNRHRNRGAASPFQWRRQGRSTASGQRAQPGGDNVEPVNVPKAFVVLAVVAMLACAASPSSASTIEINPSKDNTLYQYVPEDGDQSNALGLHFFTGETAMGELRRGALAFDISAYIPAGSTITNVTLTLNMSMTPTSSPKITELHRLLADWGEGTSQASGGEGTGAPATPNDVTWRHRFFDTIFWTTEGGDFSGTVSASQAVGATGVYTWSSPQMVADVQSWLDDPGTNFGWLVLGDESAIATSKRFDTRESASPPVLIIDYIRAAPRPRPTPFPRPTPPVQEATAVGE